MGKAKDEQRQYTIGTERRTREDTNQEWLAVPRNHGTLDGAEVAGIKLDDTYMPTA